jgi:predicted acylesterase/phospholipase RssA
MNLVTGRHELITSGPVADALARSCAISVVFAPIVDGDVIWADAGMWEPVPVSTARRWSPDPVLGVQVIGPKTALVRMGPVAWSLRTGARLLGTQPRGGRLSARRYTALLAERATDPVIHVEPDLLIRPNLWGVSWVNFAQVETPRRRGYEAAQRVLASVAVEEPRNLVRV